MMVFNQFEEKIGLFAILLLILIIITSFAGKSYLSSLESPKEVTYFDMEKSGEGYFHVVYTVHQGTKIKYDPKSHWNYNVYYRQIDESGEWRSEPILLNSYHFEGNNEPPDYKIALNNDTMGIFWRGGKNTSEIKSYFSCGEISYIKSFDSGKTWSDVEEIRVEGRNFQVEANEQHFYLVYESEHEFKSGKFTFQSSDISFKYSDSDLDNWSISKKLSQKGDDDSSKPSISVSNDSLLLSWKQEEWEGYDIKYYKYFITSEDGGRSWSGPIRAQKNERRLYCYNEKIYSFYKSNNSIYFEILDKEGESLQDPKLLLSEASNPKIKDVYFENDKFLVLIEDIRIWASEEGSGSDTQYSVVGVENQTVRNYDNNPVIVYKNDRWSKPSKIFTSSEGTHIIFHIYETEEHTWNLNHFMMVRSDPDSENVQNNELLPIPEISFQDSPKYIGMLYGFSIIILSILFFIFLGAILVRTEGLENLSRFKILKYFGYGDKKFFKNMRKIIFTSIGVTCIVLFCGIVYDYGYFLIGSVVSIIILFVFDFHMIIEEKIYTNKKLRIYRMLYLLPLIWIYIFLFFISNVELYQIGNDLTDYGVESVVLLGLSFLPSLFSLIFLFAFFPLVKRSEYNFNIRVILQSIELFLFFIFYTVLMFSFLMYISV